MNGIDLVSWFMEGVLDSLIDKKKMILMVWYMDTHN